MDKDGTEKTPVVLHRAILGSLDRFMGLPDRRQPKIGYKIREAQQVDRVPYMLVLGAKEAEAGNISVRDRKGETTTMEPGCVHRKGDCRDPHLDFLQDAIIGIGLTQK